MAEAFRTRNDLIMDLVRPYVEPQYPGDLDSKSYIDGAEMYWSDNYGTPTDGKFHTYSELKAQALTVCSQIAGATFQTNVSLIDTDMNYLIALGYTQGTYMDRFVQALKDGKYFQT